MNTAEPNRAIVLTPAGQGAIAVVRLVGPRVPEFLAAHFSRVPKVERCVHGTLSDGPRIIDDPVVVLLDGGLVADVNLHGGPWVVRSMLDLAARSGFEIIEPCDGVAPLDAFDGRTPLEQEIAAHLPLARTELGLRVLLNQAGAWERFLATPPSPMDVQKILDDRTLQHLLHPPTVAIVGAANVGKSTLANQLYGQERSITADVPGTTRDWVGEIANIDGLAVLLVDTPGLRVSSDVIEQAAIEQSRGKITESQLVVLVLDATRAIETEQAPLLLAYPDALRVINKCDGPLAWDISRIDAIHTVAIDGTGIDEVRRAIARHFGCVDMKMDEPRWWTERHREVLGKCITQNAECKM